MMSNDGNRKAATSDVRVQMLSGKVASSLDESHAELLKALKRMVKEFGYDVVHPNGLVHDEHAAIQSAIEAIARAERVGGE